MCVMSAERIVGIPDKGPGKGRFRKLSTSSAYPGAIQAEHKYDMATYTLMWIGSRMADH